MIFRFSLYGFLKNLQFFEPFLILFFRQKGFSFFEIGLLISYREICVNLLEVPSGAVADLYGRRRAMMVSFVSYIGSFALFAAGTHLFHLLVAMTLFAIGQAFRTGTHKAIIFDYLRCEDRLDEKTQFYGTTRSWSKIGTAAAVLIASLLVFFSARHRGEANYSIIFWASIVPYGIGLWNFSCYPGYLDLRRGEGSSWSAIARHLGRTFRDCLKVTRLRGLLLEAMTYEGLFNTVKDYVQPLVKQWVLVLPLGLGLVADQRTAVLMGAVYFVLALVSSVGSKQAHRFARLCGGEEQASGVVWGTTLILFGGLGPFLGVPDLYPLAIGTFTLLYWVENLWRPILLSRFDEFAGGEQGATVLSIEAQGKSLTTLLFAPAVGYLVDHFGLWTVGAFGFGIVLLRLGIGLIARLRGGKRDSSLGK